MKKMIMVWHEAGNELYHDRFEALARMYSLTVYGFRRFKNVRFPSEPKTNFKLELLKPFFSFHYLTVFSMSMIGRIRKSNADIVYIHEEPHSLLAFLICLFCRNKCLVIDAAVINYRLNFRGCNLFEKFVYSRVDYFYYRNDDVRSVLVDRGCPEQKLKRRLGNGVSQNTFYLDTQLPPLFEKKGFTVGFAGRLWKWKGVACLGDIAQIEGVQVVACGDVWDAPLVEELKEKGVLIIDKLSKTDLIRYYNQLDLFILPSLATSFWKEQFGRVIIESVFCGTPAIGSDTGFIPNLVGQQGVFKAGHIEEIVAKVKCFMDEDKLKQLFEEQSRVASEYAWEKIAEIVNQDYVAYTEQA